MHIVSKIFLFILSSLCLFFLVFFTFITPSYNHNINNDYNTVGTGVYEITGTPGEYQLNTLKDKSSSNLKVYNISLGNNIYYTQGDINITDNVVTLGEGLYYFSINSLNFDKKIIVDGANISPQGPGDFVVNTQHKIQRSVFSLSAKIALQLLDDTIETNNYTLVDLYPNMYMMFNPAFNKQIINADLLRIQNVQTLGMINSPLYTQATDSAGNSYYDLHPDIQKYSLLQKEHNYNFIKNILDYKIDIEKSYKKDFINIAQKNFYHFPGESYIIEYYSYFLNNEKKRVYYKNLILKELILMINSKNYELNEKIFFENIDKIKNIHDKEYLEIKQAIDYYYENIITSQQHNPKLIVAISKLVSQLEDKGFTNDYNSLLTLRSIYQKYHNNNLINFHKTLNSFVDEYQVEMNMSIYDENHRVHNYFLFFLKNILIADFSKVKDHNDIITLFHKYIQIKSIFIEKGSDTTKKTALFDNASILKVFLNITKINFFQTQRDDKKLLVLLKPAGITNDNYLILNENLTQLLSFHKQYSYFLENSQNRKDKILHLNYKKYSLELKEYFLALSDYNEYVLEYDKAAVNPVFEDDITKGLNITDAILFIKQFNGVSSLNTNIQIRDYGYCLQPITEYDIPVTNDKDGYCFKIENLSISGFIFSFILTPSEGNTITHLKYIDRDGIETQLNITYPMDKIKEDSLMKFQGSQSSEKDKYDFSKFFSNNFINKNLIVETKNDSDEENKLIQEFTPPSSNTDSFQIRNLKTTLIGNNGYLKKIRDILPIQYDYLVVTRNDNSYNVNIFPTNFQLTLTDNTRVNRFFGKFKGTYLYGSKDTDNIFTKSAILLQDPKTKDKYTFLLNKTYIQINGDYLILDTQKVLSKLLYPYGKIENIYNNLHEQYNNQEISITYNLEDNNIVYDTDNGYTFTYNMEGLVDIYKNNSKIGSSIYSKLDSYLNTLP